MGRPRKYPLPPALEDVASGGEDVNYDDLEVEELVAIAIDRPEIRFTPAMRAGLDRAEPEQLVEVALARTEWKLTPAMVYALNLLWRDYVKADDDEAKMRARKIVSRLRRAKHDELHAGCERVKITVPPLRRSDGNGMWLVRVNEKPFVGEHEMWECEARTILQMVAWFNQVEANRKSDTQHAIDLDSGGMIAERVAAIRRA